MAYGKTEERGIRCCYHGWLFSPDGEILETPGEDPESKPAAKLRETCIQRIPTIISILCDYLRCTNKTF